MSLEMCVPLFSFVPFSYVHRQLSVVFKVTRQCLHFGSWKEIKTGWDLRRNQL